MRVAGSRPQGPVGQVSRGLGARAPRAWGPAHRGLGPFPNKNHSPDWRRRRGCRLKRLLRRWGPGGKRSRDTPQTGRVFTLSALRTIQHAFKVGGLLSYNRVYNGVRVLLKRIEYGVYGVSGSGFEGLAFRVWVQGLGF